MAWTTPRTWVSGELVTAAIGNTHWRDQFNVLATVEEWIPVYGKSGAFPYVTARGATFVLASLSSAEQATFILVISDDFGSVTQMTVLVIPDSNETIQWDQRTTYFAPGELVTQNTEEDLNETASATTDVGLELDVSAAFTSVAAGDYVGFEFESNTTIIRPAGIKFVWAY